MNKNEFILTQEEIEKIIQASNKYILNDTDKKLLCLKSNYKYFNKGVVLVDKNLKQDKTLYVNKENENQNYEITSKGYWCDSWEEVSSYISGICKALVTNFYEEKEMER